MLRSFKGFRGYGLAASDGDIGQVEDLLLDDRDWTLRYLVADTGTWLPGRLVILSPESLGEPDWQNQVLHVKLTCKQIEESPAIEEDKPVSRRNEERIIGYYGWPAYWTPTGPGTGAGYVTTAGAIPADEAGAGASEEGEVHLRSAVELMGYRVQAHDDDIGHVDDFVVDEKDWVVRFMVIDTRNWLPGKHVILSPDWVVGVSWDTRKVRFDLPSDKIKDAPPYDPSQPVNAEDALKLLDYYGRPQGWVTTETKGSAEA